MNGFAIDNELYNFYVLKNGTNTPATNYSKVTELVKSELCHSSTIADHNITFEDECKENMIYYKLSTSMPINKTLVG
jgi:hypothetical protein